MAMHCMYLLSRVLIEKMEKRHNKLQNNEATYFPHLCSFNKTIIFGTSNFDYEHLVIIY